MIASRKDEILNYGRLTCHLCENIRNRRLSDRYRTYNTSLKGMIRQSRCNLTAHRKLREDLG